MASFPRLQKLKGSVDKRPIVDPHNDAQYRWASIVLGWTVQDIINERMYLNKVEAIPTTFKDLHSYYKAFQVPLLEDTRAQLQRGLEEIGRADHVIVRRDRDRDAKKGGHEEHSTSGKKLLKINLRIVKLIRVGRKEDAWKPKPTDVLLLCSFLPRNVKDLQGRRGGHYTLAVISSSDDDFVASFKVKACVSTTSGLFQCKSWYAIYVNNAATIMRIWDALNPDPAVFRDDGKHTVPKQNLYREKQIIKECTTSGIESSDRKLNHLRQLIKQYCISRDLNEPQREAVSSTVMGLMKSDGVRTKLLQGPPGTGKTTVITAMMSIMTCLKDRILVSIEQLRNLPKDF